MNRLHKQLGIFLYTNNSKIRKLNLTKGVVIGFDNVSKLNEILNIKGLKFLTFIYRNKPG